MRVLGCRYVVDIVSLWSHDHIDIALSVVFIMLLDAGTRSKALRGSDEDGPGNVTEGADSQSVPGGHDMTGASEAIDLLGR